jgi:hypothetical protein
MPVATISQESKEITLVQNTVVYNNKFTCDFCGFEETKEVKYTWELPPKWSNNNYLSRGGITILCPTCSETQANIDNSPLHADLYNYASQILDCFETLNCDCGEIEYSAPPYHTLDLMDMLSKISSILDTYHQEKKE